MGLFDHMKPVVRTPAPTSVEQRDGVVHVTWDDGVRTEVTVRELRLGCPCAACIEEWSGRKLINPAQIEAEIGATTLEPVGNYALSVTFSDGHSTGIYSWKTLRGLGKVS